jgi:hypothetical protein
MVPIKKLSDGRSTCLGWPLLNGSTQQSKPNDGVNGGMDVGEVIKMGGTCGGGRLLIALGGEWSDEKN